MDNSELRLKDVDIAEAVAYFGEAELLDFIGTNRLEEYLVSAQVVSLDDDPGPWAKLPLHRHVTSAKVQLGSRCKMTIQADFAESDKNEVMIEISMDKLLGKLLRPTETDLA